ARHRRLPDRRGLLPAPERGALSGSVARELSRGRDASRAGLARLAVRLRHSPSASGFHRPRHPARHPAPRPGRDPHRAAPHRTRRAALPSRELRRGAAPAVCGVRENAARAAAVSRPAPLSRRPAPPALRRHRPHAAALDGRHGRSGPRLAPHRPLAPRRATDGEPERPPLRRARRPPRGIVPLVYRADRRGVKALRQFARDGGTLVALNDASRFVVQQLLLPVRNVLEGVADDEFYAPGSIFRLELDPSDPIARGMPAQSIAWYESGPAFEVL